MKFILPRNNNYYIKLDLKFLKQLLSQYDIPKKLELCKNLKHKKEPVPVYATSYIGNYGTPITTTQTNNTTSTENDDAIIVDINNYGIKYISNYDKNTCIVKPNTKIIKKNGYVFEIYENPDIYKKENYHIADNKYLYFDNLQKYNVTKNMLLYTNTYKELVNYQKFGSCTINCKPVPESNAILKINLDDFFIDVYLNEILNNEYYVNINTNNKTNNNVFEETIKKYIDKIKIELIDEITNNLTQKLTNNSETSQTVLLSSTNIDKPIIKKSNSKKTKNDTQIENTTIITKKTTVKKIKNDIPVDNTTITTTKKKSIPPVQKQNVWNTWAGKNKSDIKCFCCKTVEIFANSFHCGHVVSENMGGKSTVENLRPICNSCNSSMGIKNMDDYMKEYSFN